MRRLLSTIPASNFSEYSHKNLNSEPECALEVKELIANNPNTIAIKVRIIPMIRIIFLPYNAWFSFQKELSSFDQLQPLVSVVSILLSSL